MDCFGQGLVIRNDDEQGSKMIVGNKGNNAVIITFVTVGQGSQKW